MIFKPVFDDAMAKARAFVQANGGSVYAKFSLSNGGGVSLPYEDGVFHRFLTEISPLDLKTYSYQIVWDRNYVHINIKTLHLPTYLLDRSSGARLAAEEKKLVLRPEEMAERVVKTLNISAGLVTFALTIDNKEVARIKPLGDLKAWLIQNIPAGRNYILGSADYKGTGVYDAVVQINLYTSGLRQAGLPGGVVTIDTAARRIPRSKFVVIVAKQWKSGGTKVVFTNILVSDGKNEISTAAGVSEGEKASKASNQAAQYLKSRVDAVSMVGSLAFQLVDSGLFGAPPHATGARLANTVLYTVNAMREPYFYHKRNPSEEDRIYVQRNVDGRLVNVPATEIVAKLKEWQAFGWFRPIANIEPTADGNAIAFTLPLGEKPVIVPLSVLALANYVNGLITKEGQQGSKKKTKGVISGSRLSDKSTVDAVLVARLSANSQVKNRSYPYLKAFKEWNDFGDTNFKWWDVETKQTMEVTPENQRQIRQAAALSLSVARRQLAESIVSAAGRAGVTGETPR